MFYNWKFHRPGLSDESGSSRRETKQRERRTFIKVIRPHRRVHVPAKIDPYWTVRGILEDIFDLDGVWTAFSKQMICYMKWLTSRMLASFRVCERSSLRRKISHEGSHPISTTCTHLGLIVEPNVTACDELDPSSRRYNALLIVNLKIHK